MLTFIIISLSIIVYVSSFIFMWWMNRNLYKMDYCTKKEAMICFGWWCPGINTLCCVTAFPLIYLPAWMRYKLKQISNRTSNVRHKRWYDDLIHKITNNDL